MVDPERVRQQPSELILEQKPKIGLFFHKAIIQEKSFFWVRNSNLGNKKIINEININKV